MKMKKRLLSILLSLLMMLGLISGMSLTAYAAVPDKVYYRVYDYSDGKLT